MLRFFVQMCFVLYDYKEAELLYNLKSVQKASHKAPETTLTLSDPPAARNGLARKQLKRTLKNYDKDAQA